MSLDNNSHQLIRETRAKCVDSVVREELRTVGLLWQLKLDVLLHVVEQISWEMMVGNRRN